MVLTYVFTGPYKIMFAVIPCAFMAWSAAVLTTWCQTSLSLAFLQAVRTPKFKGWTCPQLVLGRPRGLLQSAGGLSAAASFGHLTKFAALMAWHTDIHIYTWSVVLRWPIVYVTYQFLYMATWSCLCVKVGNIIVGKSTTIVVSE